MENEKLKYSEWLESIIRFLIITSTFFYALGFILVFTLTINMLTIIAKIEPTMYILNFVRGIGAFILLGSCIGVLFRIKVAYYTAFLALFFIGFSGMVINIVIEVMTPGIPASPGGLGPDIFWYVIVPIAFGAYFYHDSMKKRWIAKN